jgi:hypothetical protein
MWGPVTPAQIGRYLPIQSELIQEGCRNVDSIPVGVFQSTHHWANLYLMPRSEKHYSDSFRGILQQLIP